MIEIQVYQVTKQEDGNYAASLNFVENGKVVKRTTVVAKTKEEFKSEIRIFKQKIMAGEAGKQSLLGIVQSAINEVMAEG